MDEGARPQGFFAGAPAMQAGRPPRRAQAQPSTAPALAAALLLASTFGCRSATADFYWPLAAGCDGGSAGAGGSGGNGGAGGGTTTPASCIPSNISDVVDDSCGVFVSSSMGSDDNHGTKDKPYATIAKAIGGAKGQPVYLCGETFGEAVELAAGALIYGALDCSADWAYASSKRSTIAPAADMIPLRVKAKASAELYDVDLRSADATLPGGSSTAMIAETETDVMLSRSNVTAGRGADGASGAAFDMPATSGADGLDGNDACGMNVMGINVGGASVKNTCGAEDSISGKGGVSDDLSGSPGGPGLPDGAINGGAGEGAMACTDGAAGDPGMAGASGPGASGKGSLFKEGFTGVTGGDGVPGKVAQGGGGGGGAKGGAGDGMGMNKKQCGAVSGAMGNAGASGASGGAGGCGGAGGKGGGAGGASIGILSLGAALHFEDVTITAAAGGKGGDGGAGQAGGAGGMGGAGGKVPPAATDLKPGCKGGTGGTGGAGGRGGGGLGGHSLGIAYSSIAPNLTGATITIGAAGQGGTGDGATGSGAPGIAAEVQGF